MARSQHKNGVAIKFSCHNRANDIKQVYDTDHKTFSTDWIEQNEDVKKDASNDGMEALMTKKLSSNNWPWLKLPFDI